MATTYTDATMGARAIGARTNNAGTPVTDVIAEEDRLIHEILTEGWLKPADAFEPVAGAAASMNVLVGSGTAKTDHYVVVGTVAGQGNYLVRHDDTTTTVTLNAAHGSLARKDEIYLVVQDNAYDASSRALPRFAYRDGTAAGSPAVPGPDGAWDAYVLLATIDIPAAAADILACTITDERVASTITVGDFVSDAAHVGSGSTAHANAIAAGAAGFMTGADKTKLDGIEASADVNPTPTELLASLLTVDGAGSGLDADKLDGLHATSFLGVSAKAADADKLDNINSTGFALASHGLHVTADSVTHDHIVTKLVAVTSSTAANIGTGLTPLNTASLVMPSAGWVRLDWGVTIENTATSGVAPNQLNIFPRDDGVNVDSFYLVNTIHLDGIIPNNTEQFAFSGTAYKYFSGANTSNWSIWMSKTGARTYDFVKGYLIATAIPV